MTQLTYLQAIPLTMVSPTEQDWQNAAGFDQYPILPSTRKALQRQLKQTDLSFEKVALIAEQDPALCWHLLQRVTKLNPSSQEQIHSVSSCISLLGMQEVVSIAKRLPVLDVNNRPQLNYLQSLTGSVLAARLAREWTKDKPIMPPEKAYWEASLLNSVTWPWQLQQVQNWQACIYNMTQGQDIFNAMNNAFGDKHQAQWQTLSNAYKLPQSCRNLWTPQPWPAKAGWMALRKTPLMQIDGLKEFKHQCQQPELFIYFANCLAWNYRIAPYSSASRRWLTLAANYLNKDPIELHKNIVQHMLTLARTLNMKLPLGCQLLLAPKNHHYPYPEPIFCSDRLPQELIDAANAAGQCAIKPVSELKEEANADLKSVDLEQTEQRKINQKDFKILLNRLSHQPENFRDWNVLMQNLLAGITEDIGLPRAYVAVLNKNASALKMFYNQGLEGADSMTQWQLDLSHNTIIKKLLERPASILVTDQNRDKMLRGMPDHNKQALPSQFMMMSLFSHKRPVGILFADPGIGQQLTQPIQPSEYMAFKTLGLTATKCITSIAEQRKQAHKQTQQRSA